MTKEKARKLPPTLAPLHPNLSPPPNCPIPSNHPSDFHCHPVVAIVCILHLSPVGMSLSCLFPLVWTVDSPLFGLFGSVDHGSNSGGSPQFLGKNYHTPPYFLKLRTQLSIWIFMPHRSDVYEKVAFRCEESPPVLRFAIRLIPVASRIKTFWKSLFFVRFHAQCDGY